MIVYFVRTLLPVGNGIPFYGALAALWCIQPYPDTTKNNAFQRSVGTLTGAVCGLIFLLLFRRLGLVIPELVYISASVFIVPVIYTTVVVNKRNASFFLMRYASKENMLSKLKEYASADKVVTFGSIKGKYDVYINDGGGNATVKKLKKICRAHGRY